MDSIFGILSLAGIAMQVVMIIIINEKKMLLLNRQQFVYAFVRNDFKNQIAHDFAMIFLFI